MRLPSLARPPPSAPQPASPPGLPRRQVDPPGQLLRLFYCTVLVCSKEIGALTDFSGKLSPSSPRAQVNPAAEGSGPPGWRGKKDEGGHA